LNFLKVLIAFVVVLVLQTMVVSRVRYLELLDLFLLMNIYFALNFNQMVSMGISIPSGLIQDAFLKGVIGINAFSKTIIVFFISSLSSRVMLKHPIAIMFLISISTVVDYYIILGLHVLFRLNPFRLTWQMLLIAAILNGVVGAIAYQMVDRFRMKKEYA
jgi:rod shape-determining protein MreD